MPISSDTNRVSYQCDGTSAVFAFPYRFHAQADLQGFIYNSSLTEPNIIKALELNAAGGLGYTISATADDSNVYPNGGSVVLNSAPNVDCKIVIFRSSAVTNAFSVSKNGPIPSSGLNNAVDYLTMLLQRAQDLNTRSIRLPDGYPLSFDSNLPNTLNPGTVLTLNSTATGFALGPTASEVASANSSAIAAAASEATAIAQAAAASNSATQANSAAVSVGNNLLLVNSAVTSVGNAVALIGSTAYWGAESASSALSAYNSQVLANSAAISAGNNAAIASSSALSASNSAATASSSALSASNSMALLYPLGGQNQVLMIHGSSGAGATWRRPPMPTITILNTSANATYTVPTQAAYLKIRMVGGGASGGSNAADGLSGAATIFGTSFLVPVLRCTGGQAPAGGSPGDVSPGGTASGGDINYQGGGGQGGGNASSDSGGQGGVSPFGGAGAGGGFAGIYPAGVAGQPNTGSGGGGSCSSNISRAGGGAGGYLEKLLIPTASSYVYTIGDGGARPSAGYGGGAGGSGVIIIEEHYI